MENGNQALEIKETKFENGNSKFEF